MPQHLTPAWVKALGEDYEQIHEIWLHRIANLTLIAYNSKYSNSTFEEKKTIPKIKVLLLNWGGIRCFFDLESW